MGKKCKDDDDYTFETELRGEKDCKWLSKKDFRKYKYCESRGWDGNAEKKVKYACRKTCANFLEGSQFDKCDKYEDYDYIDYIRPDDDDAATNCDDDKYFRFKTEFVGTKNCDWLSEKEDRKEKYCDIRGWDGNAKKKVKYACKASCGC